MATTTRKKIGLGAGSAAVIAAAVAFTPLWEGMDRVAKRDAIGTGHPITYCYGQTSEFGRVKVGTRFTKRECDAKLAESLPTYLEDIGPCVLVPVPIKTMAALLDGAYNAGSGRICHSPMVARINSGNIKSGCDAFDGWIITSNHTVRRGLIARRAGEKHGDFRKSERALCLEGLREPQTGWYIHGAPVIGVAPHPSAKPVAKSWWRK